MDFLSLLGRLLPAPTSPTNDNVVVAIETNVSSQPEPHASVTDVVLAQTSVTDIVPYDPAAASSQRPKRHYWYDDDGKRRRTTVVGYSCSARKKCRTARSVKAVKTADATLACLPLVASRLEDLTDKFGSVASMSQKCMARIRKLGRTMGIDSKGTTTKALAFLRSCAIVEAQSQLCEEKSRQVVPVKKILECGHTAELNRSSMARQYNVHRRTATRYINCTAYGHVLTQELVIAATEQRLMGDVPDYYFMIPAWDETRQKVVMVVMKVGINVGMEAYVLCITFVWAWKKRPDGNRKTETFEAVFPLMIIAGTSAKHLRDAMRTHRFTKRFWLFHTRMLAAVKLCTVQCTIDDASSNRTVVNKPHAEDHLNGTGGAEAIRIRSAK